MDASSPQLASSSTSILIGCAGWNLRKESAGEFAAEGTHLQRYAARFPAVEINSSFYRPHRRGTYEKWSASVPAGFRFSVKVPKSITHERRLEGASELLERFLDEVSGLGEKLGCLLVQLPPSLALKAAVADEFFSMLGGRLQEISPAAGPKAPAVACEPRHPSWFTTEGEKLLLAHRITRVAADPAPVPAAAHPAGWQDTVYYRLHGSPRMYYSAYDDAYLAGLATSLQQHSFAGRQAWCIFDNTALGAATTNALSLHSQLVVKAEPGASFPWQET
jgi:uncharacterized protein YecE (DUF72 family)